MMGSMKNTVLICFLVSALVIINIAGAELYKGLDVEGNVIYSDKPFDDAEKFTPPPISVMDKPKAGTDEKAAETEKPVEFKYMSFDIISPTNNQTIRNESDITVSLKLKPGLNTEEGHSVWMMLNGKPVVKNSQSMSLQIEQVDRGVHQLQAQIRNKEGKIVVRTRTTTVFLHKAMAP
jgi:hypothetical protein